MVFPSRRPKQRERSEQSAVTHLLRSLGAKVYTLGTTRRKTDSHFGTMQTPGLQDLQVFLKRRGTDARELLFVECKAKGGRLTHEQQELRDLCRLAGVHHVAGGVDDVIAWLIAHEYLKPDQVAHYRVLPQVENRHG